MSAQLQNIDSLIFDMDGTLWDATMSYAEVWNAACARFGKKTSITGGDLTHLMGMSIPHILDCLLGDDVPVSSDVFLETLSALEAEMMPTLGGILFPGVKQGLETLAGHYRLFMLSNCSAMGLVNFTVFTGTRHLFEGLLSQGERPVSKSENLRYMIDRYKLRNPIYVGDTQADCEQAHSAGVPFAFAAYGFGNCSNPDVQVCSFMELVHKLIPS